MCMDFNISNNGWAKIKLVSSILNNIQINASFQLGQLVKHHTLCPRKQTKSRISQKIKRMEEQIL